MSKCVIKWKKVRAGYYITKGWRLICTKRRLNGRRVWKLTRTRPYKSNNSNYFFWSMASAKRRIVDIIKSTY